MKNSFYIQLYVEKQQIDLANQLVDYSLKHHPVSNIWDKNKQAKTRELRFTGTLGEIIFADMYNLPRPVRSFGAIDGQDYGKDFSLHIKDKKYNIDIKSMQRKNNLFYKNYVLNIPSRNIHRKDSVTDFYYCISFHTTQKNTIASMLGFVKKEDIIQEEIGILYKKGSKRVRANQTYFTFYEDTYEIDFKDITTPIITDRMKNTNGFKKLFLR